MDEKLILELEKLVKQAKSKSTNEALKEYKNKDDLLIILEDFILTQKLNELAISTQKQYRQIISSFIDWLDENKITEISKQTTIDYKNFLQTNSEKTNTINKWIIVINKFLKYMGLNDTTLKQIPIQQESSNEEVLSISDYKRLLRFSNRLGYTELYLIIKILAQTGIRISELKYFTVENIKSYYIKVFNKGKNRTIIVPQELARELRAYCRNNNLKTGYIFKSKVKKGVMINASTIWRQMKKTAAAAKINKNKVHAHSFRHLFAIVFLEQYNDNITELADLLGHNSLNTTRLYTRTSDAQKRTKLERLNFK